VIDLNLSIYSFQEWVLIVVLLVLYLIQLYFIFRYFFRTLSLKNPSDSTAENHISVIIPVRNEENKIKELVERVLAQKYSNFEVIAVDDFSQDRTAEILGLLAQEHDNFKMTGIGQEIRFSEKMSINLGLKASSSEWVLFLNPGTGDIDPNWLQNLNAYISEKIDVVVAYSNIEKQMRLNGWFYRVEKYRQYLQSISFTIGGRTFISDQENVLIRKSIYFESGGFRKNIDKHFANLEFLLNEKVANKRIKVASGNTRISVIDKETNFRSYINLIKKSMQIRKNLGTGKRWCLLYDEYSRIVLMAAFVLIFLITPLYWEVFVLLLVIQLLLIFIMVLINQRRLKERKIFLSSLMYILLRPLLTVSISLAVFIKDRRDRWI